MTTYNLYIDESCHLENDGFPVMCIGYMKITNEAYDEHKNAIKSLKRQFKTPTEVKWSNLSPSRLPLYKALIDYFFDHAIDFRCILVKYKDNLDHAQFNMGSHDNFYYKLIFFLLRAAVNPPHGNQYRVYLDIKDTRGIEKLEKIHEVLTNAYNQNCPFIFFQHIHSSENVLLQLTDIMIGAITYKARGEHLKQGASQSKVELINYLEGKSGYSLDEGTEPWESKFNIFDHQPKKQK
jgi:hypothetical protein